MGASLGKVVAVKFSREGCVFFFCFFFFFFLRGGECWTRIIRPRYIFHTLFGCLHHSPRGQITYFHNEMRKEKRERERKKKDAVKKKKKKKKWRDLGVF